MSLPMSVTIKDIAREAGVSYASVSRALSGSRGVSVKTAQRILAVAKKLNYLPNGIARNLVNQRSKTLGLILPDISNPFFSDIALAVIHTAERAGYQTILSNTDWEPRAQERQLQLMREQRVDGIILKPVQDTVDGAAYENLGLPAVLLHYSGSKVVSCVDTDHDYGGYLMTRHLLEMGHRRIGLMFENVSQQFMNSFCQGWELALKEEAAPREASLLLNAPNSMAGGYAKTMELLDAGEMPEAVFCASDEQAFGVLKAAHEKGVRVPTRSVSCFFRNANT